MDATVRARVVVRGLVQGVWYRDSCARVARDEGVAGWVRNRSDGTVEAVFEGPIEAVVGGMGPRATGLKLRGTGRDAWVYLALFLVFAPVVWLASQRPDFAQTYPFFPPRLPTSRPLPKVGGDWVAFEAIYFLQFLAVEYFFRGFMVLGLKPALGRAAILVMLAPYCMIHFHKPGLEALGAVGAGLVLGSLSYRTGTVVYGWFLHYAVALSMDLLSLSQSGRL